MGTGSDAVGGMCEMDQIVWGAYWGEGELESLLLKGLIPARLWLRDPQETDRWRTGVLIATQIPAVMVVDHAALGGAYTRLFRPCQHTGLTNPPKTSSEIE